jgi:hypothetical protein
MKKQSWVATDPLAWVATALLGTVAAWSLAISFLFRAPAAPALLTGVQSDTFRGQVVLVAAPGDEARALASAAATADVPRLPLRVISLPAGGGAQADPRLWSLLRSYGYDRLPVLVVLDKQGRLVKASEL